MRVISPTFPAPTLISSRKVVSQIIGTGGSVKYEDVYLYAYETPASLRAGLTCYFQFYNGRRRHSSLGRRTPDVVYFDATSFGTAA